MHAQKHTPSLAITRIVAKLYENPHLDNFPIIIPSDDLHMLLHSLGNCTRIVKVQSHGFETLLAILGVEPPKIYDTPKLAEMIVDIICRELVETRPLDPYRETGR